MIILLVLASVPLYAESGLEEFIDSLPVWLELGIILVLPVLEGVRRARKTVGPFSALIRNLNKHLVTDERVSRVVNDLLIGSRLPPGLRTWIAELTTTFTNKAPSFSTLARDQKIGVIVSAFGKLPIRKILEMCPSIPKDILKVKYARKGLMRKLILEASDGKGVV
jgi:hypothetical protein